MSTTELFVEQVIIGLMVLAGAAALCGAGLPTTGVSEIGLTVAASYLVGMAYDRFADTLLSRLEQHFRLRFALDELKALPRAGSDPFPEERYRLRVLDSSQRGEYANYLRSRIRLTRAVATAAPGLGVAAAVQLTDERPLVRMLAGAAVVALYVWSFCAVYAADKHTKLPKTHDLADPAKAAEYEARGWPSQGAWVAPALSLTAGAVAASSGEWVLAVGLSLATVVVTALFGWTWYRIGKTFMTFLRDADLA